MLFFNTLLFADCIVYENRTYAETGAETYRKTCNEFGGGGSVFSSSISVSSANNTCDGGYADGAYVLRVSCNTCSSKKILDELKEHKEYCKEICKSSKMYCSNTLNSWGSSLVGSLQSCGLEDHTLSGCSESSSSVSYKRKNEVF